MNCGCPHVSAIGPAFPALQALTLVDVDLGSGDLFKGLLDNCTDLRSLALLGCRLQVAVAKSSAHPLGQLPSLRSLRLKGTSALLELASQLTQRTELVADLQSKEAEAPLRALASRNPGKEVCRGAC
jgi:hypothetical protein